MKKVLQFLITLLAMFLCLSVRASADTAPGEYIITSDNGGYILTTSGTSVKYGSLSDCLGAIYSPASITFSDITCGESLSLPIGEYEISGEISSDGIISLPYGANVRMKNMSLILTSESYIRIKGGSLTVESSSLTGDGTLIRLDYSSSSSLEVVSGSIFGETEEALIDIECGRALISGADIENSGGAAIHNDSELLLCASPTIIGATYGIVLEAPMYMGASADEYFSMEPLSVQYLDTFSQGTLTEIFYEASERSLTNVSLFDKNGKPAEITYFEECEHTSERSFGGVYLPHIIKFYVSGELVGEEKALSGERIAYALPEKIVGYEFDNWYRDREGKSVYSFESRVYSSFSLYGIYSLEAPSFSISSLELTYDGEDHPLSFESLEHPLEGGYYTYEWYKDGEKISSLSRINIKSVSDSGTYSCKVTYHLSGDSASVFAENIKVNVEKQIVSPPVIPSVDYSGLPEYPSVEPSKLYEADIISGVDAGLYEVTFTLTDPENFAWSSSQGSCISVDFEIRRAENAWVSFPSASDYYIGFPREISATPLFGEVDFVYSATEGGVYTSDSPISVGSYYVKAIVSGTDNYTALVSEPLPFCILPEQVIGLRLDSAPSKIEYCAFEQFSAEGMNISAIYNSGRCESISASRLNYIYTQGDGFRVGDSSIIVEYLGMSLPIAVSVAPLSYDLSELDISDQCVYFDGCYHSLSIDKKAIVGLDQISLTYEIHGGGTDAGVYDITVTFSGESRKYIIPEDISCSLTVLPRNVDLIWSDGKFVYDSTPKLPTAYFIDALGVKRYVTVCGSEVLAGDCYRASAAEYSANYMFSNPSMQFSIAKADYDMSEILWSSSSLVYSGDYLEITLSNLPEGVSVVGYTDNRAVNAGRYVATASLRYDERNYNPPKFPSCVWEITPAQYDMSSVDFTSAEFEYDGREHFPHLSGTLPEGADGIPISYSFSGGAVNVADGTVSVTVTFISNSSNYLSPLPMTATVRIIPKPISVIWTSDSFVYDGAAKSPTADSPYAEINISGAEINAGVYTAHAESADANYAVTNSAYSYEIKKARNYWIEYPSVADFYASGSPTPLGTAYFGNVRFNYYTSPDASDSITIDAPGEYYMVAFVEESDNYLSIYSNPISVKCLEVKATGMRIEINGELVAFEKIQDSISVYLTYNDGTEIEIDKDLPTVRYESGSDSLRKSDGYCEISYAGFTERMTIEVNPAMYDTTSVYWDLCEITYDGQPHAPILCGLPEGVEIVGCLGSPGINAGEYAFSAVVSYDEENYLAPDIPLCVMVIKKAVVPAVSDITAEYSGSPVEIQHSDVYCLKYDGEITESGEYTVLYSLLDTENYIFSSGDTTCSAKITVLPRKIYISVSDIKLHWLEYDINPEYTIEGEIADGDDLDIRFYVENETVYAKTDNANYILVVEGGAIERLPYPNDEMRGKIVIGILSTVAIVLGLILIFKNRDNISDALCMYRAKKKHRQGTGYINNAPIDSPKESSELYLSSGDKYIPKPSVIKGVVESSKIPTVAIPLITETTKSSTGNKSDNTKYKPTSDVKDEIIDNALESSSNSNRIPDFEVQSTDEDMAEIEDNGEEEKSAIEQNNGGCDNSESDKSSEQLVPEDFSDYADATFDCEGDDTRGSDEALDEKPSFGRPENDDKDIRADIGDDSDTDEPRIEIKMQYANSVITDTMAKKLIKDEREIVYTTGRTKSIINVDTLSRSFMPDDRVDVNILKKKSLIPYDTNYIKVLARGAIDKPLHVYANEFSLTAVKMILLSGGEAIRVISEKQEKN